jgi:hypothetical protein
MIEKTYKGYIIEPDYDGDSDNYARFLIKKPNGETVKRGVYECDVKKEINKLPSLLKEKESNKMNDRYIIKCIAIKNIKSNKLNEEWMITKGNEYWYNPEANTFICADYELVKKFFPYKQFPSSIIPVTKIQNNAKIFKKLATAKDHSKIVEDTGYFKCEIYRVITTIEKL